MIEPGTVIGPYRIDALLGTGGMGEVYRGVHVYLNRPAAVKVLHANLASDSSFQQRFQQEARAAAQLSHPNVIDVYDFGEQSGRYYLVMELLQDGSMRTLLQRWSSGSVWPPLLGLDLVRQAAEGLDYAHTQGMVHRDIKPDNLLLRRQANIRDEMRAGAYQVKISDFGLARLAIGDGVKTMSGMVLGTPAYMSPEQCMGVPLDGRSDLYSLGVVLYEVATGYRPFQVQAVSDAVFKHLSTPPPPPRQIRPDITPALEQIILRCLAKRPEERYATGGELAAALQAELDPRVAGAQQRAPRAPAAPPQWDQGFPASGAVGRSGSSAPATEAELVEPPTGRTDIAVSTPPPSLGYAPPPTAPRIRVRGGAKGSPQVIEIPPAGLTLGREPDNDVVLEGDTVSRHHLRITCEEDRILAVDLGSSNGTLRGGARLAPHTPVALQSGESLRVGQYWVVVELPPAEPRGSVLTGGIAEADVAALAARQGNAAPGASPFALATPALRIGVELDAQELTIVPGVPTTVRLTVSNNGATVDHFTITVEGIPPAWVTNQGTGVQLNPGAQQAVTLQVNVAKVATNAAGDYPVVVRARSRENPSESGLAQSRWTVQPFRADALQLRPPRSTGRGAATYMVTVRNDGNAPVTYTLSGEDDQDRLAFHFMRSQVGVEPRGAAALPLRVRGPFRWLGNDEQHNFTVRAQTGEEIPPQAAAAQFTNQAFFPPWAPKALLTIVALVALLAGFALTHGFHLPGTAVGAVASVAPQSTQVAQGSATAAPSATPLPSPSATLVQHTTDPVVIPFNQTLSAAASCDANNHETLISGGYTVEQKVGDQATPFSTPGASFPSSTATWTVFLFNNLQDSVATLRVTAYCLQTNFPLDMQVASSSVATVTQDARNTAQVTCPNGSVLTGGGFRLTSSSAAKVTKTAPPTSNQANTWLAAAVGLNGNSGIQTYALCATKSLGGAPVATQTLSVDSAMTKDNPPVACPSGQTLTGGGFAVPLVNNNPDSDGEQGAVMIFNGMADSAGTNWKITVYNGDLNQQHKITVVGVCVKLPAHL